jgi:hypothetical protein
MQYKILNASAVAFVGTDFDSATEHLADQVNRAIAEGWKPLGGIAVGGTQSTHEPFLFQAMFRD